MKGQFTIKKIIAVFLLGVFALGITPKKTLHSLLANHTDSTSKSSEGKTQQLSKAGFNCKVDDLVAESNFIAPLVFTITSPFVFHLCFTSFYNSFLSLPLYFANLRGPPLKF